MRTRVCTVAALALLAMAPAAVGQNRVLNLNDLKSLQVYIEGYYAVEGKMPDKTAIMALLKEDKNAGMLVKVIEDGFVVLTGTTEREAVWAYEAAALTKGGYILSNQGFEKLSAAQVKQRLGK